MVGFSHNTREGRQMADELAALAARVEQVSTEVQHIAAANAMNTAQVLTSLDSFRAAVTARFDRVEDQFAAVDERFNKVDEQFAKVDERFDKLEQGQAQIIALLTQLVGRKVE